MNKSVETVTKKTIFDSLGAKAPMAELINWELVHLDKTNKTINISYQAIEMFTNPVGNIHGGFVVAMLDETMGSTIVGVYDAEVFGTTISLSVDYLRPVKLGKLLCKAKITSAGKSIAFLEGTTEYY